MKLVSRVLLGVAKRIPRGYWRIIRFAAKRDASLQDMAVTLRNISRPLRADLRESVFVPLYLTGRIPHQVGFDMICKRLVRAGDLVFDVGANVGYTAALFSDLVGSSGSVLALEPSPRAFSLLSRSLAVVPNIELLNVGVSSGQGCITFFVPAALDRASFLPIEGAEEVTVDVTTLTALTRQFGQPSLVKVDVEGCEPEVFSGAGEVLAREDRPMLIFEALGQEILESCCAILRELSNGGYRFLRIVNDGTLIPAGDQHGSNDYLAIPPWAEERLVDTKEPVEISA